VRNHSLMEINREVDSNDAQCLLEAKDSVDFRFV